ncbi:MAG TPA: hypothetical protein VFR84_18380 [Candidatus Angelobacter sp.]|nr:hypothetical protein [Candidatus Angelobacter sp.]
MIGGKIGIPELIIVWLLMMDFFPFLLGFGVLGVSTARVFLRPS